MAETVLTPIEIGLTAAIVAVEDGEPAILVAGDATIFSHIIKKSVDEILDIAKGAGL